MRATFLVTLKQMHIYGVDSSGVRLSAQGCIYTFCIPNLPSGVQCTSECLLSGIRVVTYEMADTVFGVVTYEMADTFFGQNFLQVETVFKGLAKMERSNCRFKCFLFILMFYLY